MMMIRTKKRPAVNGPLQRFITGVASPAQQSFQGRKATHQWLGSNAVARAAAETGEDVAHQPRAVFFRTTVIDMAEAPALARRGLVRMLSNFVCGSCRTVAFSSSEQPAAIVAVDHFDQHDVAIVGLCAKCASLPPTTVMNIIAASLSTGAEPVFLGEAGRA
jgi:hypothetical protein